MAHVVCAQVDSDAFEERGGGLPIGDDAGEVGLESEKHQVIHELDFLFSGDVRAGFGDGGFWWRHIDPLLFFGETFFDIANALEVFVELGVIVFGEAALEIGGAVHEGV